MDSTQNFTPKASIVFQTLNLFPGLISASNLHSQACPKKKISPLGSNEVTPSGLVIFASWISNRDGNTFESLK
jgi:ABC-type polar amino acid transport system ATPase subunit